ncbi:MAG: prepilin peptidase [Bdellovibrionales bacterium]
MSSYISILHAAILAAAAVALLAAAYHDIRSFRIPNIYCLILLLLFPAMVLSAPHSMTPQWTGHLIVFAIVLALGFLLTATRLIGAGDAKLIASLSLWAGPAYALPMIFYITLAGGLLALSLGLLTWLRATRATPEGPSQAMAKLAKTPIPYGIAIAIGGIVMIAHMAQTHLVQSNIATG